MVVTGAEVHGDLPRPVSYCKHGTQLKEARLIRTVNPVITIQDNLESLHFVSENISTISSTRMHSYEVHPRKDHRGVNLISDALPFGRLWYGEPDAITNAIGYAKFYTRSHRAVIRVYNESGQRD